MPAPLISVVIPAYDAARTLQATVRSVLTQTVGDFEIIIVDDGSQDETLSIARALTDKRVNVTAQSNGGAAAARNAGIRAAQGRYVALLDADDLWLPYKLERQLAVLESSLKTFAVQAGAIFINDYLELLSVRPCVPSKDALLETLLFRNMPNNMSTLIIARHKFEEMGYFDTSLQILEEWDMAIKVARYCNLVSIGEPLSLYRVHSGNRSRNLDIHIKPGLLVLQRLFNDPTLPSHIQKQKKRIQAHFYTMLAGGAFRGGRLTQFGKWAIKAMLTHPESLAYMAALPLRRLQRYSSGTFAETSVKAVAEMRTLLATDLVSYNS